MGGADRRSRRRAGHEQGFALFRAGGRKNEDGDALDRRRACALPRSLPGRDRTDQLRRARRVSASRDLALLEALADFAAIAIENARHVQRIHELTITDDCTSLYNARHLNFILDTEIYRSQRYGFEFSLIFIDLDHFKAVNDTHGHLMGSKLLAEIGKCCQRQLPPDRFRVPLRRR